MFKIKLNLIGEGKCIFFHFHNLCFFEIVIYAARSRKITGELNILLFLYHVCISSVRFFISWPFLLPADPRVALTCTKLQDLQ